MPGGKGVDINGEARGKYRVEQGPHYLVLQHQSFICGKKEVIDGKMAQIKGNVCFWFCFISNTRGTHTKAYVPCPYHWGG